MQSEHPGSRQNNQQPAPAQQRRERSRRGRRDRHGRGMRGPLAPRPVPIALTRAERFDDLASEAVERLTKRWSQLNDVRFAVLDVPEAEAVRSSEDPVPLGRTVPATEGASALIILYRRPLELRAETRAELEMLVHDILVEQVADLLGLDPDVVDPEED